MLFLSAVCDPVLGDEGQLYVGAPLIDAYKNAIIPLATMLTPNQFEAETLTGVKITSAADAIAACKALHDMGPSTVVSDRPYWRRCGGLAQG